MDALIHAADVVDAAKSNEPARPLVSRRAKHYGPKREHSRSQAGPSGLQAPSTDTKDDPEVKPPPVDAVVASITPQTAAPTKKLSRFSASTSDFQVKRDNKFTPYAYQRRLNAQDQWQKDVKAAVQDAEILKTEERGKMVAEGELERTWRVTQDEIIKSVGEEQARYRKEWKLDGGPYRTRYTRNGRHLAIAGKMGHVASFDWQTGTMHSELQLGETCRDITYLNDHSHFAVAQKQHVYIYDQQGIELHRLREHIDITRVDYLPYHWLLVTVGNPGVLRYHDTSMGKVVAAHKTKLGGCSVLAQNQHNAVVYLGHQNGTVTLWTPNMSDPAVKLLAHLGGVTSVSVDPTHAGRYMATAGLDGKVKVWDCRNWKGYVREWEQRGTGNAEVEWSQKGYLGVASGGAVQVFTPRTVITPHPGQPPLYLKHPIPQRPLTSLRFCPYTDMLTVGHHGGLSSIIVPGAGEPTFDSAEADPFESKKKRREREVHNLLDKIQPDLIALDPDFIGTIAPPKTVDEFAEVQRVASYKLPRYQKIQQSGMEDPSWPAASTSQGDVDMEVGYSASDSSDSEYEAEADTPTEDGSMRTRKKKKSALKAYQKKTGKNVLDPTVERIRAKMAARRKEILSAAKATEGKPVEERKSSALDRFRRPSRL